MSRGGEPEARHTAAPARRLTCRQGLVVSRGARLPLFTEAAGAPRACQTACAARSSTAHLQLAPASSTRRAPRGSDKSGRSWELQSGSRRLHCRSTQSTPLGSPYTPRSDSCVPYLASRCACPSPTAPQATKRQRTRASWRRSATISSHLLSQGSAAPAWEAARE